MSNKQVIAIFIIGVVLLLGAFWAGLYVVKQDTVANANNRPANQNTQNNNSGTMPSAAKPATASTSPQPPPASGDTRYIVQVGSSFGTAEKANELSTQLRKKYASARTQFPTGSDTLFRVQIGPYNTREDAQQVANELASQGFKGVMIVPWTGGGN
jgi:cell division protein FtsN